jgi:hypothetical protein
VLGGYFLRRDLFISYNLAFDDLRAILRGLLLTLATAPWIIVGHPVCIILATRAYQRSMGFYSASDGRLRHGHHATIVITPLHSLYPYLLILPSIPVLSYDSRNPLTSKAS